MKLATIYESLDSHMPDASQHFRFGDCTNEVLRVVIRALDSGFRDFTVVEGMVGLDDKDVEIPHAWIELRDGSIRDPTASQFKGFKIQYSPQGAFREEFSAEEYPEHHEFTYGVGPSDI